MCICSMSFFFLSLSLDVKISDGLQFFFLGGEGEEESWIGD